MIGLGTIVNTAAIAVGGTCGLLFGKFLKPRHQEGISMACGVSTLFIGMAGAMQGMLTLTETGLSSGGSMLLVLCLVLGALAGEIINIESGFDRFGEFLKRKTHSEGDGGFVNGFVTASLTVCIGAMAIVGSIQDGLTGDWSLLGTKAVLDFVIVLVMCCSLGKGALFSFVPVFVCEGAMTVLAVLIKPLFTEAALANISLVGSVLIFCVGINLVWGKKIRVANLLPSLVFAVIAALF